MNGTNLECSFIIQHSRILVSNVLFQGNTNSYSYGSAGLFIGSPWGEMMPPFQPTLPSKNRNSSKIVIPLMISECWSILLGRVKGVTIGESKFTTRVAVQGHHIPECPGKPVRRLDLQCQQG